MQEGTRLHVSLSSYLLLWREAPVWNVERFAVLQGGLVGHDAHCHETRGNPRIDGGLAMFGDGHDEFMDKIGVGAAVARRFEICVFQLFDGEILVQSLLEGEFDVFGQFVEHFCMGQFDGRNDFRVRRIGSGVVVPCVFGEGAARAEDAEDFAFDG